MSGCITSKHNNEPTFFIKAKKTVSCTENPFTAKKENYFCCHSVSVIYFICLPVCTAMGKHNFLNLFQIYKAKFYLYFCAVLLKDAVILFSLWFRVNLGSAFIRFVSTSYFLNKIKLTLKLYSLHTDDGY